MNRGRIFGFTWLALAVASACSLVHSLDDLTNGAPNPDAGPIGDDAQPLADGASPDSPIVPVCPPNTDYQNDARNCGRCAHDCIGGPCQAGICQPYQATSSSSTTQEMIVYAGTIYYSNMMGEVIRWPIGDETSETLAGGQGAVQGLATDGVALYWVTPASGTISRCQLPRCGQTPTVIASGQQNPWDIAWDPGRQRIIWTNHIGDACPNDFDAAVRGDIQSVLPDGGDLQVLVPDAGTFPSRIAVTDYAVYWTVDPCKGSLPMTGTLWNILPNGVRNNLRNVPNTNNILDLAADDAGTAFSVQYDHVYTTGRGPGGTPGQLGDGNPQRVALDDSYLYWTSYQNDGGPDRTDIRWNKRDAGSGATPDGVVQLSKQTNGSIALAPKVIYFAFDNKIMALAKP